MESPAAACSAAPPSYASRISRYPEMIALSDIIASLVVTVVRGSQSS